MLDMLIRPARRRRARSIIPGRRRAVRSTTATALTSTVVRSAAGPFSSTGPNAVAPASLTRRSIANPRPVPRACPDPQPSTDPPRSPPPRAPDRSGSRASRRAVAGCAWSAGARCTRATRAECCADAAGGAGDQGTRMDAHVQSSRRAGLPTLGHGGFLSRTSRWVPPAATRSLIHQELIQRLRRPQLGQAHTRPR
jgi:hypothetical protein